MPVGCLEHIVISLQVILTHLSSLWNQSRSDLFKRILVSLEKMYNLALVTTAVALKFNQSVVGWAFDQQYGY